jgi:hypothetical protein
MRYELKVVDDNSIKIKKIMDIPLWNSNQVFDDFKSLKKYITDFVEVETPTEDIENLTNSAPMNSWIEF